MVKIVPIVGYAKTYELVYERFLEMCRCKEHFVRRECATAFPVMCEVLGNELFEKSMVSWIFGSDRRNDHLTHSFRTSTVARVHETVRR